MMFFPESLKRRQRFLEELEKKAAEKVEKVEENQTVEEKQPEEVVVENKIQDTSEVVAEAAPIPEAPAAQSETAVPQETPKKKRGRRKKTTEQPTEAASAEDDADDDDDDDNVNEEVKQ